MKRVVPSAAFLLRHPAHFYALGFGAGLAPMAPGTFGTLVAIPIAFVLWRYTDDPGFVIALIILGMLGVWAAAVTGKSLGAPDHGAIVCDEVVAFLLILFFTGANPLTMTAGFVLFRFFDIVKPPPIRQFDARFKNGWGVMVDDLLAAGYVLLILACWRWISS